MTRRVAAVTSSGICVSELDEDGWRTVTTETEAKPECVSLDHRHPERVLVGTYEEGLWRSLDAGEHFEQSGQEAIAPSSVTSIAVHPQDGDRLLVGTEPSELYRSGDGGDSWEQLDGLTAVPSAENWSFPPRPYTHHVRWIEIDPTDPNRIYIGIEAGALVYSTDGGETWEDRPPGSRRDNHTLATHPNAPGRIYSAAGDGYAESNDSGETWQEHHEGLSHRYVWGLAVDRGDPETVIISAASGASDAHRQPGEAYLYRKTADTEWTRLDDRGIPIGLGERRAVLSHGPATGEFFAATDAGLFRSTNGGQQWDRLAIDSPVLSESLPRGLDVVARP